MHGEHGLADDCPRPVPKQLIAMIGVDGGWSKPLTFALESLPPANEWLQSSLCPADEAWPLRLNGWEYITSTASVHRGTLLDSHRIVAKCASGEKDVQKLRHEYDIYNYLRQQQGDLVPSAYGFYRAGNGIHLLLLEDGGPSLEALGLQLSTMPRLLR